MKLKSIVSAVLIAVTTVATSAIEPPTPNILDVEFNADGSAVDNSPLNNYVQRLGYEKVFTFYHPAFDTYLAHFENPFGGTGTQSYYKIDYSSIQKFYDALNAPVTLECIVSADYSNLNSNYEYKPFSSMEGGGIGFLLCSAARSRNGQNEFTFLPYASGTWTWCVSGVTPAPKKYYHLVGVYDKTNKKALIYVDGKLCNEVSATAANLQYPGGNCKWFAIGGDPSSNGGAQCLWRGDVGMTRIYDKALSKEEVEALWNQLQAKVEASQSRDFVTDYSYITDYPLPRGGEYEVRGKGFAEGDYIMICDPHQGQEAAVFEQVKLTADGASVHLPEAMSEGYYVLYASRGDYDQYLGIINLKFADEIGKGAEVIAHRGFWTALPQKTENSVAALEKALENGFYGSECDIWVTSDDRLVVNHDESFKGYNIAGSSYETTLKYVQLSNGEPMPTLDDFFDAMDRYPDSPTKLIIEIKTHSNSTATLRATAKAIEMAKARGMQNRVEYISFSLDACRFVRTADPSAKVACLQGYAPSSIAPYGIHVDFSSTVFYNNPTWLDMAHKEGLTVNVWTIDDRETMIDFNLKGADYITTDYPEVATEVKENFDRISAITDIEIDPVNEESPIYYNLQGVQIGHPTNGIYIVRRGSSVTKELIRR